MELSCLGRGMTEPFLKWAGGKRWMTGLETLPKADAFRRYLEPFLGGGAVFFKLQPTTAILSDLNGELINLYRAVRDEPEELRTLLEQHHRDHSREHYYAVRANMPLDTVKKAARTLYLNRTCWNGLYRVNRKGEFNVPIGTKTSVITESEDFTKISQTLKAAELRSCDFASTIEEAGKGDFLFVDPPYTMKHNMNGFIKYNENIFTWADQLRLRDAVTGAAKRGAAIMITNADHESLRELYARDFTYMSLSRSSVLSAKSSGRGPTTEAMFTVNL